MAHVVFLRAANVGGHNVFKPTQLAAALRHLEITNIGAAGTFVVHGKTTPTAIREQILANLAFVPEIVVCRGTHLVALVESDPFRGVKFSKDLRGFVAALCGKPKAQPGLPLTVPAAKEWGVRLDRVEPPFAFGVWRRLPRGFVIPANAVERALGVSMTVRWWETFVRIANAIEKGA